MRRRTQSKSAVNTASSVSAVRSVSTNEKAKKEKKQKHSKLSRSPIVRRKKDAGVRIERSSEDSSTSSQLSPASTPLSTSPFSEKDLAFEDYNLALFPNMARNEPRGSELRLIRNKEDARKLRWFRALLDRVEPDYRKERKFDANMKTIEQLQSFLKSTVESVNEYCERLSEWMKASIVLGNNLQAVSSTMSVASSLASSFNSNFSLSTARAVCADLSKAL